ncbi:MAG: ribosome silencing factor [Thermoleophilia bacterium]|nr:ribosome silencing factor [Thermoleophilia bacterium]
MAEDNEARVERQAPVEDGDRELGAGEVRPAEPFGPEAGIPVRDRPRAAHSSEELELIRRHALLAAATASGLKGEDIRIIDMHELVTYTDYLVVCSGRSTRQTRRIAEEVTLKLKKELGLVPAHTEGAGDGEWVLVDYLDFIVHVFTPEAREFYRLDVLWKEAPALIIE